MLPYFVTAAVMWIPSGSAHRAFDQSQARQVIAELHAYGVHVWLAEFDGPVDLTDPAQQALRPAGNPRTGGTRASNG